ncbi:hypothetical protein B0I35DRAFT_429938 [Stachybotrys elegans]|uniref:Secreted protein n=1 Tax=Stachybotrys elegans TaxID=80388 RepID=A0A8K0WR61_9HYPO|nr:hypothetical protein B0I35DRAFT_429938 [Stachybotrys elegans]
MGPVGWRHVCTAIWSLVLTHRTLPCSPLATRYLPPVLQRPGCVAVCCCPPLARNLTCFPQLTLPAYLPPWLRGYFVPR